MVSSPLGDTGNAGFMGFFNVSNAPEGQGKTGINRCAQSDRMFAASYEAT